MTWDTPPPPDPWYEVQLELPFDDGAAPPVDPRADAVTAAAQRLYPGHPLAVEFRPATSTLVALRTFPDGTRILRAQPIFREAPAPVAEAIVRIYLGRPRREQRRSLSHLIHAWHHREAPLPPSPPPDRRRRSLHHDLDGLFHQVNRSWFEGRLDLDIALSPRPARRTMGRHERRNPKSLILVNPLLDHPDVERWYLDFLVYHECLHEVIRPRVTGGRIEVHPPEFRAREREHPDHPRVRDYEHWLTGSGHASLVRAFRQRQAVRNAIPSRTKSARQAKATRPRRRPGSTNGPSP